MFNWIFVTASVVVFVAAIVAATLTSGVNGASAVVTGGFAGMSVGLGISNLVNRHG